MGVSPFLAWGDFHARSRFARSTIPEEKWGTTRNLLMNRKYKQWLYYSTLNVCTCITMPSSCYNENNTMRLISTVQKWSNSSRLCPDSYTKFRAVRYLWFRRGSKCNIRFCTGDTCKLLKNLTKKTRVTRPGVVLCLSKRFQRYL